GIRDFHVTGVQTCALPISMTAGLTATATVGAADDLIMTRSLRGAEDMINKIKRIVAERDLAVFARIGHAGAPRRSARLCALGARSEERRVGKECTHLISRA